MKHESLGWHVASIMPPGPRLPGLPRLGGAVEAYRGWQPCVNWCIEQIDRDHRTWQYAGEGVFVFEREQDRTCFLLKWA